MRRGERDLGEVAHRADHLRERREPGEVARGDAQHHARAQLAQRGARARVVVERSRAARNARIAAAVHVPPARLLDLVGERGPRGERAAARSATSARTACDGCESGGQRDISLWAE